MDYTRHTIQHHETNKHVSYNKNGDSTDYKLVLASLKKLFPTCHLSTFVQLEATSPELLQKLKHLTKRK